MTARDGGADRTARPTGQKRSEKIKHIAWYDQTHALSYADYGDKNGDPILIQHGLIASIEDGDLFRRLIQSGRRVISIARPGYGASSPHALANLGEWGQVVAGLVGQLRLGLFDVLAMSSGAPYAYALGRALPSQVRAIYVFSGTPALYDPAVQALWPFPLNLDATLPELQQLAHELFFSNLSAEDLKKNDIRDSMANNCFGIAQDLKLRCQGWGFALSEVKARVYMQHSRSDEAVPFITAELTSKLLPNCTLQIRENGVHFSDEALDDFIRTTMRC